MLIIRTSPFFSFSGNPWVRFCPESAAKAASEAFQQATKHQIRSSNQNMSMIVNNTPEDSLVKSLIGSNTTYMKKLLEIQNFTGDPKYIKKKLNSLKKHLI